MKRWNAELVGIWSQSMTTYRDGAPRKLRPEEKFENQVERWDQLSAYMDRLIEEAYVIRNFAQRKKEEVRAGQIWQ